MAAAFHSTRAWEPPPTWRLCPAWGTRLPPSPSQVQPMVELSMRPRNTHGHTDMHTGTFHSHHHISQLPWIPARLLHLPGTPAQTQDLLLARGSSMEFAVADTRIPHAHLVWGRCGRSPACSQRGHTGWDCSPTPATGMEPIACLIHLVPPTLVSVSETPQPPAADTTIPGHLHPSSDPSAWPQIPSPLCQQPAPRAYSTHTHMGQQARRCRETYCRI